MWFVHHRINRMNPCLTSRSSAPAPQGSLVFSGFVGWRGALIVGVGHVEERARAPGGRVHGVILPWLCWKGKHPFAPRAFLGFGCRSRCVGLFQPPGVPTRRGASRPAHGCPARPWDGFQAGPPAFVFGSVGGRSIVPARSPTRRSRGRGVTLWPVFSEFSPPAPLSFGVRHC